MPTFNEFLKAYKDGVLIEDSNADVTEGSVVEILGGTAALFWARESQRDKDLFDDASTSTATGDALTDRVAALYGTTRVLDAAGKGTALISRLSTSAGAGTIWEGTRIALVDRAGLTDPLFVEVAADTACGSTDLIVSLPVRALAPGNGAVSALGTDMVFPRFSDTLFDATWTIDRLVVAAGKTYEPASAYLARAKSELRDKRSGFKTSLINACRAAGAERVALFVSDYAGAAADVGLNMVYVGDASYSATTALVNRCALALESSRILGDATQVRPMQHVALTVSMTVYLVDAPTRFNTTALLSRIQKVVAASIANDFSYTLDGFRGAVFKACPDVSDIDFITPSVDGSILTTSHGMQVFPASLTRYTLAPEAVTVSFKGPR